ncbi:MAG: tetratricopeptide repeat protein [Zoogloeaceae bacterium]|nr:tetratricopeptide repeat protein [Zoogloeaceae bacterium]
MLMTCPECKKQIFSKTVACPNCGHPGPFIAAGEEEAPGAARPEEHQGVQANPTPPPEPSAARETSRKSLKRIVAIVLAGGVIVGAFAGYEKLAQPPSGLASAVLPNEQASSPDEQAAKALFDKGIALLKQGNADAAIAAFDEVDRRFGQDVSPGVREWVARALGYKGVTLIPQGDADAGIAVYDEIARRFGQDASPGVREQVALALLNKGVTLEILDKTDAAIAIYDEIERRFGQDDSPGVRGQVARAKAGKKSLQGDSPGERELAAKALLDKVQPLWRHNKPDAAIAVYDEVDRRFGQDASPGVRELVARALFDKGETLVQQDKPDAAITVYDEIERRFGQDASLGVFEPVNWARARSEQITKARAEKKFFQDASPEQAAKALFDKGVTLLKQGQRDAAIAAFDEVDRRFGQDASPGMREQVAGALFNKGETLVQQGKRDAAIAVYDEIDRRFGQDASPDMREWVAGALFNKGDALGRQGKPSAAIDAIAVYDEVDRRFGQDDSPDMRRWVSNALLNKGVALGRQGKADAEIAVYDEVDRRFGQDASPGVREQVAKALYNKGVTLGKQGNPPPVGLFGVGDISPDLWKQDKIDAAIAVYDEIERRFGQDDSPGVREQVAEARAEKKSLLASWEPRKYFVQGEAARNRKQWKEAVALYTQAIKADPKFAEAYDKRSEVYFYNLDDYESAKRDAEAACHLGECNMSVQLEK